MHENFKLRVNFLLFKFSNFEFSLQERGKKIQSSKQSVLLNIFPKEKTINKSPLLNFSFDYFSLVRLSHLFVHLSPSLHLNSFLFAQPSTRNLIHLVTLARILVERHAYHATHFFSLVRFDFRPRLDSTFSKVW